MPLEPLLVPFGYRLKEQYRKGLVGHWKMNVGGLIIPDLSNNGNYGTRTNYNWTSASGWAGQGDILDGSNDYVDASSLVVNTANAFSISAWVKVAAFGGVGQNYQYPGIVKIKTDQTTGFGVYITNAGDYEGLLFGSNLNFVRQRAAGVSASFLNTWKHVDIVYNGLGRTTNSNYKVYVDGDNKVLSDTLNFAILVNETIIGKVQATGSFFNGIIDDVRIYNRALSADEIAHSYFQQEDEWDLGLDDDIPAMQDIPIGLFQQGQVIG